MPTNTTPRNAKPKRLPLQQTRRKHGRVNRTGVCGVALVPRRNAAGKITRVDWEARWYDEDGERDGAVFSIRKHGYREGWEKAVKARANGLGEPVPKVNPPPVPEWVRAWIGRQEWTSPLDR